MKRIFVLGFMLGALSLAGCTNDIEENANAAVGPKGETLSFTAVADDARTVYEPGVGVHITGDETVAVVYTQNDGSGTVSNVAAGKQLAETVADGTYRFNAPALADGYSVEKYFFVMPNGPETRGTATESSVPLLLPTIQAPLNHASFDTDADILVGRPQTPDMLRDGQATVVFKRLFTPVKMVIKGLTGKKLYTLTFKSGNAKDKMSGYATQVACDVDYDATGAIKWHSSRFSPGITTVYAGGLDADENGNFNVWMIANPGSFSDLTVTVTTDEQVVARTINSTVEIPKNKLMEIGVNMASATVLCERAVTFDFLNADGANVAELKGRNAVGDLTGSDGVGRTWTLEGNAQSYAQRGLYLPKGTGAVRLPGFGAQSRIAAIRGVVDKFYNNNAAVIALESSADGGETWETVVADIDINRNIFEQQKQGVFEIEIPAAMWNPEATYRIRNTSSGDTYFRNLTVVLTSSEEENDPDKPKTYYEIYEEGGDILIGGMTVNKSTYPGAKLVNIANVSTATFTGGGLVFIDGGGSYTMTASPSIHSDIVVIGNNPEAQPRIVCYNADKSYYFAVRGQDCTHVFKNLNIDGSICNYIFNNSNNDNASGDIKSLIVEDCTITTNANVVQDANTTTSMQNVAIRNCIINMVSTSGGKAVYGWATTKENNQTVKIPTKATDKLATVTVTDNVVYAPSMINHYLVMVGSKAAAYESNAEIVVERNSTYNIYHGNGVVSAYAAADIRVNGNVFEFDDSADKKSSYCIGYSKADDAKQFTANNNFAFTNTATQYWKAMWKNTGVTATADTSNNSFNLTESPFASADMTTGYFPIDKTVVTADAGASYDTKLWFKHE